jgi:hypothetical protein
MPDVLQFFVITFSRTEASEIQTNVVFSASSEQDAMSVASHFTGQDEGAIALLRSGGAQKNATISVLAQFGGALPINSDALERLFRPLTLVSASDGDRRKVSRDNAPGFVRRASEQ